MIYLYLPHTLKHTYRSFLIASLVSGVVYLLVLCLLVYGVERHQSGLLLAGYCLLFGMYLLLLWGAKEVPLLPLLVLAAVARLLLVPAVPALSDDFYRFLWDGHLLVEGLHPFSHPPAWYMQGGLPSIAGLTPELYEGLNSKQYFTIYPPLAQAVFAMAALFGGDDIFTGIIALRLPVILAEAGTIWLMIKLLDRYRLPRHRVLLYALNPLVLLELTANLHLEAYAIFFLMLLLWAVSGVSRYRKYTEAPKGLASIWQGRWKLNLKKVAWASTAFAGAVASKLWPLMLGPYLVFKMGGKRGVQWLLLSLVLLLLLFIPFFGSVFFEGLQNSLSLYYQRFEFNASLYYLLRAAGQGVLGYNPIVQLGPLLGVLAAGLIVYYSWRATMHGWTTPNTLLLLYGLFLLFATTVHPWYVLPLVALMPLTSLRFPLLWSGLVFLTYAGYTPDGYREPLVLIALEYALVVAFLLWELRELIVNNNKAVKELVVDKVKTNSA